jgi:hypothetical protein
VAGSRDLKRSAQIEFFLKGFGYSQCSGSRGQSILLSQREIENLVRNGEVKGGKLKLRMTLTAEGRR